MASKHAHNMVFAIVGGCALTLSSCGGSGTDSGAAPPAGKGSVQNAPSWCGTKKATLALTDGFGGNNWRRVTTAEAKDEVAKCPSITQFSYADGQGNTQKAISDIQGFVAKGVNALVVFPDAGQAMLPALRSAKKAGVITVPYRVNPGGKPGVDYDAYIDTDFKQAGVLWARWLVKTLNGKGNVLNLGGPPANSQSQAEFEGMQSVFKNYPGIKFVGQTPYEVTNWDPAQTQKVVAAALAKNPQIDAITTDFGAALASSFGTFDQVGRKIPAVATEDSNLLSCEWKKRRAADPGFKLFTVSSQNAMSRLAIDYAVAKATGGKLPGSTQYPQSAFEDSVAGKPHAPKCDTTLSMDAFLSSSLTHDQQAAALK
jgi:ABC-type sugar transport system substrate-binding protein